MRVAILSSGLMGGKLGTIFVRGGHEIVFSCPLMFNGLRVVDEVTAS